MTPQSTAQISANAGKTQTRSTSLLLFGLPDFLQLDATNRPLPVSPGGHSSACPSQDDADYTVRQEPSQATELTGVQDHSGPRGSESALAGQQGFRQSLELAPIGQQRAGIGKNGCASNGCLCQVAATRDVVAFEQIHNGPEDRGVITFEERGIRVAESWWDEIVTPAGVDLVRLLYRREPADGDRISPCPTFRVSLRVVENPLRGTLEQLMYAFEPDSAIRVQRGLALKLTCRVQFHPSRRELEQFFQFAADKVRPDGCSPAGLPRLAALSDAYALRLSTASDAHGRVLAQHCYLRIGDRARLLDGAFARAADGGSTEGAEAVQSADPFLLYWDMVTLHETDDVKILDLPVLESADAGTGLRGRSVTLYNTERSLSPAGRQAIGGEP